MKNLEISTNLLKHQSSNKSQNFYSLKKYIYVGRDLNEEFVIPQNKARVLKSPIIESQNGLG